MAQARRVLERHGSARIIVVMVLGIPAAALLGRGQVGLGIALLLTAVGLVVGVVWTAPSRRLQRMARRARAALPADDGQVTIVGTVMAANDPLVAPHSKRACVAYWERSLIETEGTWSTTSESTASVDFVLRCGEDDIVVEGSAAEVLHEPASATRTISADGHAATEELAAQLGDPLVVAGRLVRRGADGPFRATARIEPAGGAGLVLGLGGSSLSMSSESSRRS